MYRVLSATVPMLLAALLVPEVAAQPGRMLQPGEKFEGEMKQKALVRIGTATFDHYRAELPIMLKAGQSIDVSVTVVGKGRRLFLRLLDPSGAMIGDPIVQQGWSVKTAEYKHEEVPSSGKYTIQVWSDLAGPFTLRATVPGDESEVKVLERRREQLRRELEEIDKRLKALRTKGPARLLNGIEKK